MAVSTTAIRWRWPGWPTSWLPTRPSRLRSAPPERSAGSEQPLEYLRVGVAATDHRDHQSPGRYRGRPGQQRGYAGYPRGLRGQLRALHDQQQRVRDLVVVDQDDIVDVRLDVPQRVIAGEWRG